MADVSDSEHRVKFDDQINRSIKSRPLLIRQNRKKKCCTDSCNTDSRTGILFVYSLSPFFLFSFSFDCRPLSLTLASLSFYFWEIIKRNYYVRARKAAGRCAKELVARVCIQGLVHMHAL